MQVRAVLARRDLRRGLGRQASKEAGFTVVELTISMMVFLVILLAAARSMSSGMHLSGDTRARVVATNLATQAIEQIRGPAADPGRFATSFTLGKTTSTQKVDATTYTITETAGWVGQGVAGSECDSGGAASQLLRLNVAVSWPNMGSTQPVESTTTLAAPVGVYSANSGNIAVKIVTAAGAAVSNAVVTAAGAVTQSAVAGADGCVFFAYVAPGTYTVSISLAGWVSGAEQATPSQTTSVTTGQTAALAFSYDQSATINVSSLVAPVGTLAASGMPISVGNAGLQPNGYFSFASGTTALTPLFPYQGGYYLFTGNCTDSNPLGLDTNRNRFYPSVTTTSVGVLPGSVASAAVPLWPLLVTVKDLSGNLVTGATLTALTAGTCPNGTSTYTLRPTVVGVSANAVGLGKYTVTAHSGTKVGTATVWVKPTGTFNSDGVTPFLGTVTVK